VLYDIGFLIFSIFYLPILLFKGKLHKDFLQRFGVYDKKTLEFFGSSSGRVWIQAVSVGEVALCKMFIPMLKERYPGREIVLSTITKTGYDLARKSFAQTATVIYFPLDLSFIVRKVVKLIRPRIFIMIETEIWPNLLNEMAKNGVLCVIVNGRISDKSIGKYRLVKPFLKKVLNNIMLFCMRSQVDADRIIELGARKQRVRVTGNMKFDIGPGPRKGHENWSPVSIGLNDNERLFVAGSTHPGEEEMVLEAFKAASRDLGGLRLLIAPRHIDRVVDIEAVVKKFGFKPVRVTSLAGSREVLDGDASNVLILDSIGQLNDIYSAATLVFIGGSLVKHGGHNPIEPAVFEKPILFGPHMFNFRDTASVFVRQNAAIQVCDRASLSEKVSLLLRDETQRKWLGQNARRVVAENCGATERNLKAIKEVAR
jgi:3-deoxy-D-manno-octulosonic-acid transferase